MQIRDYRAALAKLPIPPRDRFQNDGIVRIRGSGSLNPSNIPTTCPNSMAWLVYLNAIKANFPDFEYKIEYTDSEVPQFKIGENLFSHPQAFDGGEFTLEPRVENVEGVTENQRVALERVEQMRESLQEAFTNITDAYLYGYHLLSDIYSKLNDLKELLVSPFKGFLWPTFFYILGLILSSE